MRQDEAGRSVTNRSIILHHYPSLSSKLLIGQHGLFLDLDLALFKNTPRLMFINSSVDRTPLKNIFWGLEKWLTFPFHLYLSNPHHILHSEKQFGCFFHWQVTISRKEGSWQNPSVVVFHLFFFITVGIKAFAYFLSKAEYGLTVRRGQLMQTSFSANSKTDNFISLQFSNCAHC